MQFLVQGFDGTDDGALARRMAAREAHLVSAKKCYDNGQWLFASALLDDEGIMIGSFIVCEYSSEDELQKKWLQHEPYVLGDVWKKIEITRIQIAPFCIKK